MNIAVRGFFFGVVVGLTAYFLIHPSWLTAFALTVWGLMLFSSEVIDVARKAAERESKILSLANERAEKGEERVKALVEAGIRMERKFSEMEARLTRDSVANLAGLKR